jgi:hypothetical protein
LQEIWVLDETCCPNERFVMKTTLPGFNSVVERFLMHPPEAPLLEVLRALLIQEELGSSQ